MNEEILITRGCFIPRSVDLCGLRTRMIKLLNLPWNPAAGCGTEVGKRAEAGNEDEVAALIIRRKRYKKFMILASV